MNVITINSHQNRAQSMKRGRGYRGFLRSQITAPRPTSFGLFKVPEATPSRIGVLNSQTASARQSSISTSLGSGRKQTALQSTSARSGRNSEIRTPRSALTSTSDVSGNSSCIVALTEGRGHARGEVGIAALDTTFPHLILCQISDSQEYINTLTKLNVFNPVEILVPYTFCAGTEPSKLYQCVQETFPTVTITKVLRRHYSDTRGLQQIQHFCAAEYSSVEIVLSQKFYALASAAALIKYVEFSLNKLFSPKSLKVEYQGSQNTMVIDIKTAHLLELTQSLRGCAAQYSLMGILNHCHTSGGVRLLRANILEPPCLQETIIARLDCVEEIVKSPDLFRTFSSILPKLNDVDQLLALCMHSPQQDNIMVAEHQMKCTLLLKNTLELIPSIIIALQDCQSGLLCHYREVLSDERYQKILSEILSVIHQDARTAKGAAASEIQRNFAIKAGVNELLDVARQAYCEIVDDISGLVSRLAETYKLPLKVKCSGNWGYHIEMVQGKKRISEADLPQEFVQVHKTRNSFSFTTQELIVADLRSKEAMKEITRMSNLVVCKLLSDIRNDIGCIYKLCETIAELDMLSSLTNLSSLETYVRPQFGRSLNLEQSRHPILDTVLQHIPVANDVFASPEYNCHIITGPNMSGKSIYIRQIALLHIMAQIGCYVPAQAATFRISDHIFSRLGFDDSIESNASTFVLELKEFQYIRQMMTPASLIIVDELCRGTSCEEGTAIAFAIVEELLKEPAFIFLTTHFLYLTKLQELYCNVVNHHFEALEETTESGRDRLVYTHRLLSGITQVENYGLRLAKGLSFPETILEGAQTLAAKISSERKAYTSPDEHEAPKHKYYELATLAVEFNREHNLNPERIKELQEKFSALDVLQDAGGLVPEAVIQEFHEVPEEVFSCRRNDENPIQIEQNPMEQIGDENPIPQEVQIDLISQEEQQRTHIDLISQEVQQLSQDIREHTEPEDCIQTQASIEEFNMMQEVENVPKEKTNLATILQGHKDFTVSSECSNEKYDSSNKNINHEENPAYVTDPDQEEPMEVEYASDDNQQPSPENAPEEYRPTTRTILDTRN